MKIFIISIISIIITYILAFVLPPNPYMIIHHINLGDMPLWSDIVILCAFIYFVIIISIKKEPSCES